MRKRLFLTLCLGASTVFAEMSVERTRFWNMEPAQLQAYAEQGHSDAQFELAQRYYAGHKVDKDDAAAFAWMSKAAAGEYPEAVRQLSVMYAEGIGTEVDLDRSGACLASALVELPADKAVAALYAERLAQLDGAARDRFLEQCISAGYKPAYVDLYYSKAEALCLSGKVDEAVPLLRKLVDAGDAGGACYLAQGYQRGLGGLRQDPVEAFSLYRQAAEGGVTLAQYELGRMCEEGVGTTVDMAQAVRWFEKAAKSGNAAAQFWMAERAFDAALAASGEPGRLSGKEVKEAAAWYQMAADQGHAGAQWVMGRLCASGEGVSQSKQKAAQWYEKAIAQKYADAFFELGLLYQSGGGVSKDVAKAFELYRQGAELGSTGALYYLANGARLGVGMPKDPEKGARMYYWNLLKDLALDESPVAVDEWQLAAAREYACIQWDQADSADEGSMAVGWASLAARTRDAGATDLCVAMCKTRRRAQGVKADSAKFDERVRNPVTDAGRLLRKPMLFPYAMGPVQDFYPNADLSLRIVTASTLDEGSRTTAGQAVQGVLVEYNRPAIADAIDFSGIILVGMELTDRDTGARSWAMQEFRDEEPLYKEPSFASLSVFVNESARADVRVTDWAVVYGHRLANGRVVAVLDSKKKAGSAELLDLYAQNQYVPLAECQVAFDLNPLVGSGVQVRDFDPETSDSLDKKVDESLLNKVIKEVKDLIPGE